MHFTATTAAIIASLLFLGDVTATALPKRSIAKRAEPGEQCFNWGEKTCNGAGDLVVTCLGPPGADLEFGGTLNCVPGFQICEDGFCVLDPNRETANPEPTTSEPPAPERTEGSCGGFLGGI